MSYSSYSYAVFGKKVNKRDLTVVKNVRSCSHDTDINKKFCSECGKTIWKQEEVFVADEGYGDKLGFFVSTSDTEEGILGFKLVSTKEDDIGYHVISGPTPEMILAILEFFKQHNKSWLQDELKTYIYTYHSY